jgi:hypothetical protein
MDSALIDGIPIRKDISVGRIDSRSIMLIPIYLFQTSRKPHGEYLG